MSHRIVEVASFYFDWPVGASCPATYAITPANLEGYLKRTGASRMANAAESEAALNANRAGPHKQYLSAEELVRCYRDGICYERFFLAEGADLAVELS